MKILCNKEYNELKILKKDKRFCKLFKFLFAFFAGFLFVRCGISLARESDVFVFLLFGGMICQIFSIMISFVQGMIEQEILDIIEK